MGIRKASGQEIRVVRAADLGPPPAAKHLRSPAVPGALGSNPGRLYPGRLFVVRPSEKARGSPYSAQVYATMGLPSSAQASIDPS
jgi:hypothetical protein